MIKIDTIKCIDISDKLVFCLFHLYPPVTRKQRWRYTLDESAPAYSGAGTIFRQNRERQNRKREIKIFAGIGAFFCSKNKRSPKKKGLRRIWSVFFPEKNVLHKKGFRRIWEPFLVSKMV